MPANLNIEDLIKNDTELTDKQKSTCIKYKERLLYPISRIIIDYIYNKQNEENEDDEENGYVSINATILKDLVGSPFQKPYINIMDFYLRNEVVTKLNYSTINKTSNRFKLTKDYNNEYYKKIFITDLQLNYTLSNIFKCRNETVKYIMHNMESINIDLTKAQYLLKQKIKELEKNKGKKLKENINNNYKWGVSSYVTIDANEQLYKGNFLEKTNNDFIKNYVTEFQNLYLINDNGKIRNVIKNWEMNILKIYHKDWDKSMSTQSGRIFNNITSLPRQLRSCLYLNDGEVLTEIDIANSQPFLFNMLLADNFDLTKDLFGDKYSDVRKYMQLTENGLLYDHLIDNWKVKIDRDQFKKLFFGQVFYCEISSNYKYKYSKLFKAEFPNVFGLIIKLKEGNYKNLSIQLQKREANIIIHHIGAKLMKLGIYFLTVHDSIICRKSDSERVKTIFEKEFKRIKLNPKLNIKDLS